MYPTDFVYCTESTISGIVNGYNISIIMRGLLQKTTYLPLPLPYQKNPMDLTGK